MGEPRIKVGDTVRPKPDSVMCQLGFQTVLATYEHPVMGRWLWLVRDDGVVGSFHESHWQYAGVECEWSPHRSLTLQDVVAVYAAEVMHDSGITHETGDSAD